MATVAICLTHKSALSLSWRSLSILEQIDMPASVRHRCDRRRSFGSSVRMMRLFSSKIFIHLRAVVEGKPAENIRSVIVGCCPLTLAAVNSRSNSHPGGANGSSGSQFSRMRKFLRYAAATSDTSIDEQALKYNFQNIRFSTDIQLRLNPNLN